MTPSLGFHYLFSELSWLGLHIFVHFFIFFHFRIFGGFFPNFFLLSLFLLTMIKSFTLVFSLEGFSLLSVVRLRYIILQASAVF